MSIEEYLKEVDGLIVNTLPTQIKARACRDVPILLTLVRKYREALERLYNETADYIALNHLGDVHHNQSMKDARDALHFDPRI